MKAQIKRFWKFLGEDSLASWIANVVLSFIVIYFVVYPVLGFLMSTSLPVVAVVSSSMEHNSYSFEEWWELKAPQYTEFNIKKEEFREFRFKNGFNKGDIMVIYGVEPKNIKVGDVVVYKSSRNPNPIIHRVVEIEDNGNLKTKGDNNNGIDPGAVTPDQVKDTGKAVAKIPWLGWVKIIFINLITSIRS